MNSKRILFITGSYPPILCGVGDYTYNLANELSKTCNEITVLTSVDADVGCNEKIKVLNLIRKWSGLYLINTVLNIVKNNNYDIIHFQYPTSKYVKSIANCLLPMFIRLHGCFVVYTMHEYANRSFRGKICRIPAVLFSNKIIVVDDDNRKILLKHYPIFKKKINMLNIGSNIPKSTASFEDIKRKRDNILASHPNCSCIVSYFGFINQLKCLELTLESMNELNEAEKLNVLLLIIGKIDDDNEYQLSIRKLIQSYKLERYVHELGFVPPEEVGDYFRCSNGAILLFKDGVSPRNGSFLAASQEPIPVITTRSEQIMKYIDKCRNIILIDNDIEDIESNLIKLQNGELCGDGNRKLFDWSGIAEAHVSIYDSK